MNLPESSPISPAPVRPPLVPGTLYLVATPLGNLEDLTFRALRVLRDCDAVCAEDTRHTGHLLVHFGLRKSMLSYHKFNEARRSEEILERLRGGQTLALVTDAGSPGISDPGQRVVAACVAAGLRVEPVPGPCALIAALTASGLATDAFRFVGFLPVKSGQRARVLAELLADRDTVALYESPYRVEKLLGEIAAAAPERPVAVARELTKKFEEWLRGTAREVAAELKRRPRKGEFVVVIGAADSADRRPPDASAEAEDSSDEPSTDGPSQEPG